MIKLVTEHHESGATYRLIDSEGLPIAAVTDFLAYIALRGLSRKTARAYAFDLLCLYRWLPAVGRDAQTLEARDLLSFVASQQQRGAGPATINRQLITIRLFLRFVTGKDMGESAILRPTRGYYKGRGKDRYLGLHQLKRQRPLLRVKTPRKLIEPLTADEVRHFLKVENL